MTSATQGPSWFQRRRGALTFTALLLGAVGCGGTTTSNNLGPAGNFIGLWELDTNPTTFTLTCPTTGLTGSLVVWQQLQFDHGVLTDVAETSQSCLPPTGVNFDSDTKGQVLTAPNPDPYSATNAAPECEVFVETDTTGNPIFVDLSFTSLTFTLLPQQPNGDAEGLLQGTGSGPLLEVPTGGTSLAQADTCTYTGTSDRYHRVSRP